MPLYSQNAHQAARRGLLRSFIGIQGHGIRLRHTFLIAILLVSSGLIASGAIELIFRYRESVTSIRVFQKEMAESAAFKIQQYVNTITQTVCFRPACVNLNFEWATVILIKGTQ
jgi:hypothetical protein